MKLSEEVHRKKLESLQQKRSATQKASLALVSELDALVESSSKSLIRRQVGADMTSTNASFGETTLKTVVRQQAMSKATPAEPSLEARMAKQSLKRESLEPRQSLLHPPSKTQFFRYFTLRFCRTRERFSPSVQLCLIRCPPSYLQGRITWSLIM